MERLPDIIPVAPAITKNELQFDWNHEAVKAYLQEVTEKYVGLVVTEENLPDMEKARREITSFRTAITRFKQDGKRKLKAPAERFARECDDLLKVVEDVEGPIAVQLARYEAARKNEVKREIVTEYQMKASAMGLDMNYWQLDISDRWLNKTQKWSDTCCAIDSLIKQQLEQQKAVEARADAIKVKKAYAKNCVEMENQRFALKTPLELEEVYPGFSSPGLGTSFKFERMACKNVRNVELSRILDDYQCEILRSHIRVHMKNKLLDLEMNCSRPAVGGGPLNIRRLAEEERLNNNAMQQCMAESLRACREAEAMAYAANQLAVQTAINNTMLL